MLNKVLMQDESFSLITHGILWPASWLLMNLLIGEYGIDFSQSSYCAFYGLFMTLSGLCFSYRFIQFLAKVI